MDDEEIEQLIDKLRALLDEHGFGWAREQAEGALDPAWHRRRLARALIDAAEVVTVDLAEAEIAMLDRFGTDDIYFKPDDEAEPDGEVFVDDERTPTSVKIERLRGPQRRGILKNLASQRHVFQELRGQLDGIV